uniref:Uncharacterized protein n=1 Tax=Opuntia streptacantha TaxID=393608 RepID=A0A7C9DQL8_OPUST
MTSEINVLFPDPLWPTTARLFPAGILRFSSFRMVTSGLVGYLKLTHLNSMSPLISVTIFDLGSSESIVVFLLRMLKTDPSASEPLTIPGVRASASATPKAFTRTEAYQRVRAYEQKARSCEMP